MCIPQNNTPLWTDVVAVLVAAFALLVSWRSLRVSKKSLAVNTRLANEANRIADTQLQTARAALEGQLRSTIADALSKMVDAGLAFSENKEDEALEAAYLSAQEMYRNAYEDACAKYNEGRIDPESFHRLYYYEIQSLVENKHFRSAYFPFDRSKHVETVKVYSDWFVLRRVGPPR